MKKTALAFIAALLLIALAGCAAGVPAANAPASITDQATAAHSGVRGDAVAPLDVVDVVSTAAAQGGAVTPVTPQTGSNAPTAPAADSYIGEAKAKETALSHSGVAEKDATFVQCRLEYDDGRWEYEVEFYAGTKEYDYEIDALTGAVLACDYDAEHYSAPGVATPSVDSNTGSYIGEDAALSAALARAGVSAGDVTGLRIKLDADGGRAEYEIDFRVGNVEYDVDVDALSGSVTDYEAEADDAYDNHDAPDHHDDDHDDDRYDDDDDDD